MTQTLWFLTRSSGVVALVLIAAALIGGLVFSGREGGSRLRPAWWLDLHRGLGGYALVFTVFHLLAAYGSDLGYRLVDVLVPGVSKSSTAAMALGVLAFYAIAVTVLTTWPKRRFRRRLWHLVHLLSIPAAVTVAIHGWQMGTDATSGWYITLMVMLTGLVMYPLGLRLSGVLRRRLGTSPMPVRPDNSAPQIEPPTTPISKRAFADATH